jgi:hypothetical protein
MFYLFFGTLVGADLEEVVWLTKFRCAFVVGNLDVVSFLHGCAKFFYARGFGNVGVTGLVPRIDSLVPDFCS